MNSDHCQPICWQLLWVTNAVGSGDKLTRESIGISATQTVRGATTSSDNPNCMSCLKTIHVLLFPWLTTIPVNGTDTFAVLHYDGASDAEPTSSQIFSSGPVLFEEFQMAVSIN